EQYKLDLSAIADQKITLVHVGEKLIILFDNQSTVEVHPYYDSMNVPLANITVEVAPGRDVTSAQFITLFIPGEDPSVLPTAGPPAGPPASGANFLSVSVDPLPLPNPLPLLPQEELPNFVINHDSIPIFGQQQPPTPTPT